jgi:hypothetical protein
VYHPQFLGQCTLAGKSVVVQHVLLALNKILKFYIEGDTIDNHLGMDLEEFYTPNEVCQRSMFYCLRANLGRLCQL